MHRWSTRGMLSGLVLVLGLTATAAWAQTPARPKLERLIIAAAPLGWDTNFTWL